MSNFCTDVVIHIDENLNDDEIHDLERDLVEMDGVMSACVNEKARHLMLVDYDPHEQVATQLLAQVKMHGMHAELVGL